MKTKLTKSKKRIRDHGEVFTPDFIVESMLKLVKDELKRVESRFLEPACGEGNFLIKILEHKINVVTKKYNKNQFNYERYALLAVSNIYGIELLDDNVLLARKNLYKLFLKKYKQIYKNKIKQSLLNSVKFILSKNIVQGDALTFKNKKGKSIIFTEWVFVNRTQIKRLEFNYRDLVEFDSQKPTLFSTKDVHNDKTVYGPCPIKEYPAVNFLNLGKQYAK